MSAPPTPDMGGGMMPGAPAPDQSGMAPALAPTDINGPIDARSKVQRTPPDVPEERRQGVAKLMQEVKLDKAHYESDFKQMRADMDFARGWQWPDQQGWEDDRYTANIVQRHVNQRVSALYAKNPTFVARRKPRMDFAVWDENPQSAMLALQTVQQGAAIAQAGGAAPGAPPTMAPQQVQATQQAVATLADIQQGMAQRRMYENLSRTLEIVFTYYTDEQVQPFKYQMKQVVRRAITCGIAYSKLGYQRVMETKPEVVKGIADASERMAHLQALVADVADDKVNPNGPEMEELRKTLDALQSEPDLLVREGLTFDYPASWSIIPDRRCKQIKGFIGCDRVSQEYVLTPREIEEIYGIDISSSYTAYSYQGVSPTKLQAMGSVPPGYTGETVACVYEVYERKSGTVCTICEGWPDYLRAPATPSPALERFWPWFPLSFNDGEHETKVFPQSDVRLLRSMQREYNRCREGLRRHRIANRPKTIVAAGVLSEEDEQSMKTHPDNAIIEIAGMSPGQKVEDLLQPFKGPPIDPALYNTDMVFQDVLRVVGSQEANLGGTSNSTATESSIAESSRLSSLQSNIDDLDDFLSDMARAGGQICLLELTLPTVQKIAGPGAVWPQMSKAEIANEFYIEVQAGSSGRPNKAQEMQNMNMILPYLIQIPGISPIWLAEQVLRRMDDRLDLTDALMANVPSIVAQNSIKQPESAGAPRPGGGPPSQGAEGANNAPQPGQGAQANAAPPTIPRTRPAVAVPPGVAARGAAA